MFLLLFVAFASQEVNGQVVVVIEEVDLASSANSLHKSGLVKKNQSKAQIEVMVNAEVFPNPFSTQITIRVPVGDNLSLI
ncbi:MAG: hypothetical protein AAGD28_25110, partial [Bacteroidota bacterium]